MYWRALGLSQARGQTPISRDTGNPRKPCPLLTAESQVRVLHGENSDGGDFTNGQTGNYDDGAGEDDTETSSRSGSTVTNSTGTVTSGTFGDDSNKIDGDYADKSEQQGSDSESGDKLDFDSSSYHDSGTFTDSSLSESRSATFTAKHEDVAANGFSDSNTASHSNDGGGDANVENDSADGSYTETSGTLTVTFNGTADDIDGADYHDSEALISTGPSSSGSTSVSYSVSVGTHSHVSGEQTQVNGAVTAADQSYTLDGIGKLAILRLGNDQASGSGENTSTSSSANDSKSSSSHDSGTHDVSGGAATDSGSKREIDNDVRTDSDTIATSFDNQTGIGSSIQTDSYSDSNNYFDSGSYTNSSAADTESDNFDGHDVASQSTNSTLTAHAAGDSGTSWTSTLTDNSSSGQADRGNEDLSNGAITDETDNFNDVNSEYQHATFDETSDRSGAVVPDGFVSPKSDFPAQVQNELPMWPGAPEFDSGNFTPPEYTGGYSVENTSTADATSEYNEMDVESGVQSSVSGSTNTSETFYDTVTSGDSSDETETSGAGYSPSDFIQYVSDSRFDTETDVNRGTVDGGVTTDHYDDAGEEGDEHSTSYSFDATADVGGFFETGHGLDQSDDKRTMSLTETGDYTTSPTAIEPTADNPNGDATFDQSMELTDGLIEWEHDSLTGTEVGNGISLSGSAEYTGNATDNAMSEDTVDVDVAGGTDTQSGNYGKDVSIYADHGFHETGTHVFTDDGGGVDTLAVTYGHSTEHTSDDTDIGNYGNSSGGSGSAGGTEETKLFDIDSADEKFVETLADGQSFTSDTPTGVSQTSDNKEGDGGKQAPADGSVQKPAPAPAPGGPGEVAGKRWFNDSGWDWLNPFALFASRGDGLGNRIGSGVGVFTTDNFEKDLTLRRKQHEQMLEEAQNMKPTPPGYQLGQERAKIFRQGLKHAAGEVATAVDGVVAYAELEVDVATIILGGMEVRAAVAGAGRAAAMLEGEAALSAEARSALLEVLGDTCFVAGTPLLTPDGEKSIESFKVGDAILSRPERRVDAPVRASTVEAVFELSGRVVELCVGGKVVETTEKHPFFVHGKGWVRAVDLMSGDSLVGHNDQRALVESVSLTDRENTVYNLRVADDHTYFGLFRF